MDYYGPYGKGVPFGGGGTPSKNEKERNKELNDKLKDIIKDLEDSLGKDTKKYKKYEFSASPILDQLFPHLDGDMTDAQARDLLGRLFLEIKVDSYLLEDLKEAKKRTCGDKDDCECLGCAVTESIESLVKIYVKLGGKLAKLTRND